MTVKELIAELSKLEQYKEIVVWNDAGISTVEIEKVTNDKGLDVYAIDGLLSEYPNVIHGNYDGLKIHYKGLDNG